MILAVARMVVVDSRMYLILVEELDTTGSFQNLVSGVAVR